MCSMDLDGIEAGLPRTLRRRGEAFDDPGDVVFSRFLELGRRAPDRLEKPAEFLTGEVVRHIHRACESGSRGNQEWASLPHVDA